MPPLQVILNQAKVLIFRNYKYLIVIIVLMVNYFLFNTIYLNFFLHVGKPTYTGGIQGSEQPGLFAFDKYGDARFEGQETYQIVGWVFPEELEHPLADYQKQIVLINDQSTGYYFDPLAMTRVDVTKAFPDLGMNVDQSGYLVNISKYVLPKGRYNVAFLFSRSNNSEQILVRTDYYVIRTANNLRLTQ